MSTVDHLRYRPEVDGLRAIAVLAVLLFHAEFGVPGGYIGVDVFFVISGFLITSLIWKDLEAGRFSLAGFWERRARRIVPALVVVTVASLLAGWFLLLPVDLKSVGRAAAAQAVFAANIHSWLDSGYFAGIAEEKPLLHTWSLAVEEQFYFVMPIVLWAAHCIAKLRSSFGILILLSCGFIASLGASLYGVARAPSAAFYFLPTRAWELLLGSLVAFFRPSLLLTQHGNLREALAVVGLTLIILPALIYSSETPFPGMAATAPCLGAALLIWTNGRDQGEPPTFVGKWLSVRALVFIGLISYSLYLWHWPLLAFSRYIAFAPLTFGHRAALLGLGFGCAILSWKYVETPFRRHKLGATRQSVFVYAATGLAIVLVFGLACMKTQGFPQRLPAQAQDFANASRDTAFRHELATQDIHNDRLVVIGTKDATVRPSILVWGDSHAMAVLPAVDTYLKELGLVGRAATHSSTAPVLEWFTHTKFGLVEEAPVYNQAVFSYIDRRKISIVILSANWRGYIASGGSQPFGAALLTTIRRLTAIGVRPFVLLDVPVHSFDVPRVLSRSSLSRVNMETLHALPREQEKFDTLDPKIAAEIEAAGGRFLDPKPRFLDPTGQFYMVQNNGVALYSDGQHLTTKGAKLILLPFLRDALTPVLRSNCSSCFTIAKAGDDK